MSASNKIINIALDATRLSKISTGIDYYTYFLIKTLYHNQLELCPQFQFTIYISAEGMELLKTIIQENSQFHLKQVIGNHPLIRQQGSLLLANIFNRTSIDIFHSMGFPFPLYLSARKKMITVHDVSFKVYPELMTQVSRWYWNSEFGFSLTRADSIQCDSNFTKSEMLRFYPKSINKPVKTVYLGLSDVYSNTMNLTKKNTPASLNLPEIPEKYFLAVGSINPRKNLSFLLEVLYDLWNSYPNYKSYKLVVVGPKGWKYKSLMEQITRLNLENQLIFTGYVPENEMPSLYKNARLFLYPSLYEGFGLPPLEAMACGTPVITSDRSSLPEIVGKMGQCLPLEKKAWIDEIVRYVQDIDYRRDKVPLGIEYAKKFTWTETAKQVIAAYSSLLDL